MSSRKAEAGGDCSVVIEEGSSRSSGMAEEGEFGKSLLVIRGPWVLILNNAKSLCKVLTKQVSYLYFKRIFSIALWKID